MDNRFSVFAMVAALVGLPFIGLNNYLLFHSLVEIFSVVVAGGIFMIAWKSRVFRTNGYLSLIGIAFLFIGGLDTLHLLAYKGMGVFHGYGTDLSVQLWIAARYMQATALAAAPFFVKRIIKPESVFLCCILAFSAILASIFSLGLFPSCYIEGSGLTRFKIISEYIISAMMVFSAAAFIRNKGNLDRNVLKLLVLFLGTAVLSEIFFTAYASVYGFSNMIGHLLKSVSFCFLFFAVIDTGVSRPYSLIFMDLERSKEELRRFAATLEERIRERTSELAASNNALREEIERRKQAENGLRATEMQLRKSLGRESALREIDASILKGGNVRDALEIACDAVLGFGYETCWIGLAEPDFTVHAVVSRGFDKEHLDRMTFRWDESPEGAGPTGVAIRTGRPQVCGDILTAEMYAPWRSEAAGRGFRSSASIPLNPGEGPAIGVLHVYSKTENGITPEDVYILETFARQCTVALMNARRMEELRMVYRRLVDQIRGTPLGYIATDRKWRVVEWNPAAERIFGWTRVEAVGKNPLDLIVPPGNHGRTHEFWLKAREGEDFPDGFVGSAIRKDAREVTCEWFATPLRDAAGAITGFAVLVHDVTEKIRLQNQLVLAQKMESVGTLAGGIAHDFNNALTGVVGFAELLRGRLASDEQAMHDLNEILRCAERASTLTRQLLAYARRQTIDPVHCDLSALVADLMKLIGKVVGERIEVITSLAEDLPAIRADRGQIEQVLMNLCLNARDAMPDGGRLHVETGAVNLDQEDIARHPYMKKGRHVLLAVSDTGIGMEETIRERAFDPFFTTKGPDKGTGLGLAMVYGIVKQHGGFVHLYSEPGKGTIFRIYFPAVDAPPDVLAARLPQETLRGGTETILVAEDEETIRLLAERTLKELGYNVLVARDGEEAVEIFRRNQEIDLAVLDAAMPRMGGKEAFDAMRGGNPRLKAIFISGYSAGGIHESFVLITGTPFLQKPFGPATLARKIREVLDTPG